MATHFYGFILWNIGQGQFATFSTNKSCLHFDAGGSDKSPPTAIKNLCAHKMNYFFLSHSDLDHIRYLPRLLQTIPSHCLASMPLDAPRNSRYYKNIPICDQIAKPPTSFSPPINYKTTPSNSLSRVYFYSGVLLLGDLPKKLEKIVPNSVLNKTRLLVVGHHGSHSSTSQYLVNQLSPSAIAFISAKKSKYGHPHFETLNRLKAKKIPTFETENWGHLFFEL